MKFSKIILHIADRKINDYEYNMNQKEEYDIYHWDDAREYIGYLKNFLNNRNIEKLIELLKKGKENINVLIIIIRTN